MYDSNSRVPFSGFHSLAGMGCSRALRPTGMVYLPLKNISRPTRETDRCLCVSGIAAAIWLCSFDPWEACEYNQGDFRLSAWVPISAIRPYQCIFQSLHCWYVALILFEDCCYASCCETQIIHALLHVPSAYVKSTKLSRFLLFLGSTFLWPALYSHCVKLIHRIP